MGALEIYPFAGCIRCQENERVLVLSRRILRLATLLAMHRSVHGDNGIGPADQPLQLVGEIIQRVAVLGEDHHLPPVRLRVENADILVKNRGKLIPLLVLTARLNRQSEAFELLQLLDFRA